MATAPPPATAERAPLRVRMQQFWRRVTEGMELSQLWSQFRTEARASYRLYSRDVAARTSDDLARRGRRMHIVKEFFWAVLEETFPGPTRVAISRDDPVGFAYVWRRQLLREAITKPTWSNSIFISGAACCFSSCSCWRSPTAW